MNKYLNITNIFLFSAIICSVFAFIIFYQADQLNLAYGDAVSRLNIARKIIDNLTPGFGQIGSVWLPLPFFLMLPFIGNDFLWHSGIAAYISSGFAFVCTVVYLYKFGKLAFNNKYSGIGMALFALTSINFLYIQTTAMSESLFILTVTGATYHLYKWAREYNESNLFVGALYISAATFIRYEGYLLFFMSTFLVGLITYLKSRSKKELEGKLIMFTTLAITGIVAWIIYNWTIFGNPFYWVDIYRGTAEIISTDIPAVTEEIKLTETSSRPNIFQAIFNFWSAAAQINGIYITILATFSTLTFFFVKLYQKKLIKEPYHLVLFLPVGVFVFTSLAIFRGFPLNLPALSIENLLNKDTSYLSEYNIRYGINMLPLIAIFFGWLLSLHIVIRVFAASILLLQIITTFWLPVYSVYQIPQNFQGSNSSRNVGINPGVIWLKQNYDNGLIMISAQKHNPEMFYLGFDYKTYIHEGAGKYWLESRTNPQKYAKWIYMFDISQGDSDTVTKYLNSNPNLDLYYDLVYQDGTYEIYKIKTAPEIEVKQ